MIRRHDNKQSVKQAAKIMAVGQICVVVGSAPAPSNRPEENGHNDIEVSGVT